jgi:V/A-type H+-transporting ATPase subunit I
LGHSFPQFAKWFFIVGPALVVLFSSPCKNILKGIVNGLGSLLLNIANSFTDVVSYIRLFAVGLATVAVADAFNKMAMGIGFNNFLQGLLTSFILLIGHLLNVILGPLSILVHGVRLNVLEFCNHLDIKWSGFVYKPLQESSV